jgi:hypothetical protein
VITGFTSGKGLNLTPSGSSLINVADTIAGDNTAGVYLAPTGSSATVQAFFERVQALGNSDGFGIVGANAASSTTIQATAADCVASGNTSLAGFGVATTVSARNLRSLSSTASRSITPSGSPLTAGP